MNIGSNVQNYEVHTGDNGHLIGTLNKFGYNVVFG